MTNPFPGMNPYLEDISLWSTVHSGFISLLRFELNRLLPDNYIALEEQRVYVESAENLLRLLIPDIIVTQTSPRGASPTATALADPHLKIRFEPLEMREPFIQIVHLHGETHTVVTVLELLSVSNKLPNTEGRKQYLSKQQELLHSTTSLIEIDLLHFGVHTVAVPLSALPDRSEWDYLVSLHRGGCEVYEFECWLVPIEKRLPRIAVPLAGDDPDVVVDLQGVLNRVYEEGRYGRIIDYRKEPPVELPEGKREWVRNWLTEQGLR